MLKSPMMLIAGITLALLASAVQGELAGVILVSRHGTRAPNLATAAICPNNAPNLARYLSLDISLEGVTGRGMNQLLDLGTWCRHRYVDSGFLAPFYSNEQLYIRAVGEDRTLQSAVAWGMGLYPAGRGAVGWSQSIPPPLPVYTLPDELDTLLENRKAGCRVQLAQDIRTYDETVGKQNREKHADLLDELAAICGVNLTEITSVHQVRNKTIHPIENFGDAVKDITDNWTFDFVEQFPLLPGLDEETLLEFRAYAVEQLIGRILGTEDQVTYMNGDLPMNMVKSFQKLIDQRESLRNAASQKGKQPLKFIAYHGHREMMYALAAWFDIEFNVSYPGLPQGAIPAATTLLFELHTVDGAQQEEQSVDQMYEVRAIIWTPCDFNEDASQMGDLLPIVTAEVDEEALNQTISGRQSSSSHKRRSNHHSDTHSLWKAASEIQCGARPIAIKHRKCHDGVCSFAAIKSIVKARLRHTGEWKELCEADRIAHEREQQAKQEQEQAEREQEESEHAAGRASASMKHGDDGEHDDYGDDDAQLMNSSASATPDIHTKSTAWMIVLYVLLGAVALGGLLYWYFVHRSHRHDRGEYQRV